MGGIEGEMWAEMGLGSSVGAGGIGTSLGVGGWEMKVGSVGLGWPMDVWGGVWGSLWGEVELGCGPKWVWGLQWGLGALVCHWDVERSKIKEKEKKEL